MSTSTTLRATVTLQVFGIFSNDTCTLREHSIMGFFMHVAF